MPYLLEMIVERSDKLRPSERKVADLILADPPGALGFNMASLATAADVSEPTVTRFCRAIGCNGFRAFKSELIRVLALGQPAAVSAISPDDSIPEIADKVFDHTISGLDRARGLIDKTAIETAVNMIAQASDLLVVGAGSSGIVAQDAQQKFVLFGKHCQAPLDYQQQYISARLSSAKTVTIAISNSGRTVTVVDAAKAAKLAGGRVISITGEASPLSELSDLDIRAGSGEETGAYAPMVSRVAALAIIDILATGVGMRASRAYLDQVRTMNEGLNKRRVGEFS